MNSDSAADFPLDRDCLISDLSRFPQLQDSWNRSGESLRAIRERLLATELPKEIETIYVCGSMGRMEMLPASDCDLVVVTNNIEADSARGNEIHTSVWNTIEPLDLMRPKPDGIFSQVVSREKLVSRETLGIVDEDQFVFGKRIQLLLDSQPVWGDEAFESLSGAVLNRYRLDSLSQWNESPWRGLIADTKRYLYSLYIRTIWIPDSQPGNGRLLNTKLRHSRKLLIAGLLACLSSHPAAETNSVLRMLKWTPLERVLAHLPEAEQAPVLTAYDRFLDWMADESFTSRLSDDRLSHRELESELGRLAENAASFEIAISGSYE